MVIAVHKLYITYEIKSYKSRRYRLDMRFRVIAHAQNKHDKSEISPI